MESILHGVYVVHPQCLSPTGPSSRFDRYEASLEGEGHFLLDCCDFGRIGWVYYDGVAEDFVPGRGSEFEQEIESGGEDG